MGKNVAVFVDVANIFYAAKAAGVDIDYVTLLKAASAGRDLVRAYAYTGLDPDNENQRNFHDFLRRSNYKVVSKDIRKYGDGKVKANLDIELVVDMMKTARNLDIAIVVSGDGDFAPAIRAVQEMGVRCEVISFRGNTSSDLMEVADQFTDITQLARVEKGTRSGRRVADADDLSMTEVPDKQTEGTGVGRGRGGRGGRGRTRSAEAEPVAAGSRGRGRGRSSATNGAGPSGGDGPVSLPGERLARVGGGLTEADLAAAEVFTLDEIDETGAAPVETDATGSRDDEAGRRRRRRGGRGRGRGRGRDEGASFDDAVRPEDAAPADDDRPAQVEDADAEADADLEEIEVPVAPRGPRSTPFGSVWDSQLGTTAAPSTKLGPLPEDDEDFDEPEIPEYLIAEQRRGSGGNAARGGQGGGRGARGGRSAYQSAMDRERFGRGGGGGINRYPDVSGRTGGGERAPERARPPRDDRAGGRRDERPRESAPRGTSSEPWSEVPPELEAMLRAQVGGKSVTAPSATDERVEVEDPTAVLDASAADEAPAAPKRRTTTRKPTAKAGTEAADAAADADADAAAKPAAKRRTTTRKPTAKAGTEAADAAADADADASAKPAAKRRTTTRKPAASATADGSDAGDASAKPAAKRRTTRKSPAEPTEPA